MTTTPMSLSRFRELARAYGGELERWPEAERDGARALAESSEAARVALDEEKALDGVFAAFEAPGMSETLAARLQRLPDETATRPLRFPRRAWRAPAIGWAAAALFGLWLGTQSAEAEEASVVTGADAIDGIGADAVSGADAMSGADGADASDARVVQLASGALDAWEDLE